MMRLWYWTPEFALDWEQVSSPRPILSLYLSDSQEAGLGLPFKVDS
jgi:hypothetical protein